MGNMDNLQVVDSMDGTAVIHLLSLRSMRFMLSSLLSVYEMPVSLLSDLEHQPRNGAGA